MLFGFSRTFNHNGPSPSRLLTCQHGKVMHPKTVSRKCAHQTPILESREQTQRGGHKINNLTTYQIVSDAAVQDIAVAGFRRDRDIPQRPVPKRKPAKQARGKGEEVRMGGGRKQCIYLSSTGTNQPCAVHRVPCAVYHAPCTVINRTLFEIGITQRVHIKVSCHSCDAPSIIICLPQHDFFQMVKVGHCCRHVLTI